jgi:phage replication-related protein YjqB (UPF0714/DUF867 family)
MSDTYHNFLELQRACTEGIDYRLRMAERGSQILIFSPHAGGIEIGASELVEAIAGEEFSYYLFEGLRADGNDLLHITSTRFDEPGCLRMLSRCQTALALHGCRGREEVIYVGGRDIDLGNRLMAALIAGDFKTQRGDGHLAGRYAKNICNRTRSGMGCQLELSTGLRRALFEDYSTRRGREQKTALFEKLVAVIRGVILDEG